MLLSNGKAHPHLPLGPFSEANKDWGSTLACQLTVQTQGLGRSWYLLETTSKISYVHIYIPHRKWKHRRIFWARIFHLHNFHKSTKTGGPHLPCYLWVPTYNLDLCPASLPDLS